MDEDPVERLEAPLRRRAFWVAGAGMVAALAAAVDQGLWLGLLVAGLSLVGAAGGYGFSMVGAMAARRGRRTQPPEGMPPLPVRPR